MIRLRIHSAYLSLAGRCHLRDNLHYPCSGQNQVVSGDNYSSPCSITTPAAAATTNVIASQCGTTLANIANVIYANQVTAANQYRFEVTDVATSIGCQDFRYPSEQVQPFRPYGRWRFR